MRLTFYVFLVALSSTSFAFTSKFSTEATLRFDHFIEVVSQDKPVWPDVKPLVDQQLTYLFGPMQASDTLAAPRGDHQLKFLKNELVPEKKHLYRLSYHYEGTIQIAKGPRTRYTVILPHRPERSFIYEAGMDEAGKVNLCTDEQYNTFGDYWYFWNPAQKGCPLKEGVHYDRIQASIERLENEWKTYPEYDKLIQADGTIRISVLFGMDDPSDDRDPMTSSDENAKSYRSMRKALLKLGYSAKPFSDDDFKRVLEGHRFQRPYVEILTAHTDRATIEVTLFFGQTTEWVKRGADAFHYFFKDANEHSSILIYDGHSELGEGLNIKKIEERHGFKIKQDSHQYQIFFFNSCSSYDYYNAIYFYRKSPNNVRNRTKFLDIITNGVETAFDTKQTINFALIHAVDDWANGHRAKTYQALAEEMDNGSSLFGVNGDEDNPTKAP